MKKIELKSRKLLRVIFGCFSFTAIAFVFQACYGIPQPVYDIKLSGTVKSKTTNLPIKGIKIAVNDEKFEHGFTDENGKFDFYTSILDSKYDSDDGVYYSPDSVKVHFLDIDGVENGEFANKTIIVDPAHKNELKINVELDEK